MSTQATQLAPTAKGKRGLLFYIQKDPWLFLMVVPAIVYLVVFKYIPMYGITVAFQNYSLGRGYFASPWVGLMQFDLLISDPFFARILRNTLLLSIYSLAFGFPASIILALLLNEVQSMAFKRTVQTVSYLPHFISTVVIVGMLKLFFATEGMANSILGALGLEPQRWWLDPVWFRPLYIASGIWQGTGWGAIIYLAALAGISQELYEAAYIDGANRFRRMRHVTLPGIKGTIILILIFQIGSLMGVGFEKVFLMYNPTTYEVADVIATYIYRRGFLDLQISFGAAVGLFNSVINLILLVIANYLARRYSEYSLW